MIIQVSFKSRWSRTVSDILPRIVQLENVMDVSLINCAFLLLVQFDTLQCILSVTIFGSEALSR